MALNYSSVTKVIGNSISERDSLPNNCKFLLGEYQGSAILINLFKILVTDALSIEDINRTNAITNLNNLYKVIYYKESILDSLIESDQFKDWFKGDPGKPGSTPSWEVNTSDEYINKLLNPKYCRTISVGNDDKDGAWQFKWLFARLLGLDINKSTLLGDENLVFIDAVDNNGNLIDLVTGTLTYSN